MNSWKLAPFVRFTIPFVLGIVFESYTSFFALNFYLVVLPAILLIYICIWQINKFKHRPILPVLLGFVAAIFLFLSGAFFCDSNDTSKSSNFLGNISGYQAYVGIVDSEILQMTNTSKCIMSVRKVKCNGNWISTNGKVLIYMNPEFVRQNAVAYGDEILVNGKADSIQPPMNPGEFDYKRYLKFANIFHRDYLNSSNAIKIESNNRNAIVGFAIGARAYCGSIMKTFIQSPREFSILSALVLGFRGQLDAEIIQAYSSAGAMHVLSVSGLHVALVFQLLSWAFGFLKRGKWGIWIYYSLSLLMIWGYAFLTGLCPSVMRSVVMFTIILVGQATNRSSNIFNSIALSAFILLLYNPMLVMDVGFQLSYLAVLGIVYLQPRIYSWWVFKSVLGDWVWQITAVSLAAQIVTAPLGALYFHQFPAYFLVSNLIVIPTSTIMLYGGIGLFFVSWLPFFPVWLGYCLEKFTWGINELLIINQHLPGALIEGIYLEVWETWLIFAWLGVVLLLFERKKFYYLVTALLLTAIGSVHASIRFMEIKMQKGIFVYQIPKHTAIEWVHGEHAFLWTDVDEVIDKSAFRFHISNNHIQLGISNLEIINIDDESSTRIPIYRKEDVDLIVKNNETWLIVKRYTPLLMDIILNIKPNKIAFIRNGLSNVYNSNSEMVLLGKYLADGSNSKLSVSKTYNCIHRGIYFTSKDGFYYENGILK